MRSKVLDINVDKDSSLVKVINAAAAYLDIIRGRRWSGTASSEDEEYIEELSHALRILSEIIED
jgi:hypothetical protein